MTILVSATALVAALNAANPNVLPDMLRSVKFGSLLRALPAQLYSAVPAASSYVLTGLAVTLPDDAKGALILQVYARTGSGTAGPLVIDTTVGDSYVLPAAGHCSIAPTGDLVFAAADAWTAVDVLYQPAVYDVVEQTFPVASDTITFPTTKQVMFILEAEALAGGTTGTSKIDVPAAAKPGTSRHFALTLAKLTAQFKASDAVTSARVKYAVKPAVDVNALLTASSNFI